MTCEAPQAKYLRRSVYSVHRITSVPIRAKLRAIEGGEAAIRKVMNQLIDGTLCPEHPHMFQEIYHGLLFGDNGGMPDPYFVLKDLPMYMAAQAQISRDYTDKDLWLKKAVMNTACSGVFAADRTIQEYNDKIWHLKPLNL